MFGIVTECDDRGARTGLDSATLLSHAKRQWKAEPSMRVDDAYKWLFHATQGGDHAVGDDDTGPRRWLVREWARLAVPSPGEPEVVPLDPHGRFVRINLRPYRARGGDPEMLLAVFVASARRFRPDKQDFARAWNELGRQLKRGPVAKLTFREWRRLDRETKPVGYPAIHHSGAYEAAARPAYRVVLAQMWIRAGTTQRRPGS